MPAFVPGVQPWATFDGAYSLSADQEALTLTDTTTPLVSPWYDCATTAAKILETTTATGTLYGRTSTTKPTSRDDRALIQPASSECTKFYDPSLGTKPDSQGFTDGGATSALSGGYLNMTDGYYYANPAGFTKRKLTIVRWRWRRNAGHAGTQQINVYLPFNGNDDHRFVLMGSAYGANAGKIYNPFDSTYMDGVTMAVGDYYDCMLMVRSADALSVDVAVLHVRAAGTYSQTDLEGTWLRQDWAGYNSTLNGIYFGEIAVSVTDCTWGSVLVADLATVDQNGFEALANPDASFARNQRYWQVKYVQSATGTFTELDIQADLSAPAGPVTPDLAAINDTAIAVDGTAVVGAAAYLNLLVETAGGTTVDSQFSLAPAWVFRGLAANTYRVDMYACSDDGVRSATAGSTASQTLPIPSTTPTAPTIGPYPRFVSGVLRFYKPTAGTNTPSYFNVLSAGEPNGEYGPAVSVAWGSITWRETDGVAQYVTASDLGLTVDDTAWCVDEVQDVGNLSARGNTAVYGGDSDNRYCLVTFTGLTSFAGRAISVTLSQAVTVQGATLPRGPYPAPDSGDGVIAPDGTASIRLPRCDGGTAAEGTGTPYGVFTGASLTAWVLDRRIPDKATATFASLIEPGTSTDVGGGGPADDGDSFISGGGP